MLSDNGNIATLLTQLAITKIISKSILNINKNKMNNLNNDTFNLLENTGTNYTVNKLPLYALNGENFETMETNSFGCSEQYVPSLQKKFGL